MNRTLLTPQRRAMLLRSTALGLATVTVTLLYLWQHQAVVDLGYRIETARTELAALSHQKGELLLESARLSSLGRIERIASEKLHMIRPQADQLVRVIPESRLPAGGKGTRPPVLLAAHHPR